MNLKPILVNLLLFTFIFGTTISIYAKDNSKTIEADAQKSSLEWIGKKVLGQHSGNVNLKSGTLFVKGSVLTGGNFVIDMTSISCTDINDAAYNANLIKHLKSTDFFNVDEFTTATLKITKVLKFVNKSDSYNLTADLTVKGITKSISFPATFSKQGNVFETKIGRCICEWFTRTDEGNWNTERIRKPTS